MLVVLVSVPLILAAFVPAVPPVMPPDVVGTPQLYVMSEGTIPSVTSTGLTLKLPPLQIAAVLLLTAGVGFTVTVTVNVEPVHGPAGDCGVTVYVAVPAVLPVLASVPVIFAPDPPTPPVTVALITGAPQV